MKSIQHISVLTILLMASCALVSDFDQNSYSATTEIKMLAVALVSKGLEPASTHASEIAYLEAKLSAQLAYEDGKGKTNKLTAEQWRILISYDHNLLGAFLKDWKSGIPLSAAYVAEKKIQVGEAFDEILRLEGSKAKG